MKVQSLKVAALISMIAVSSSFAQDLKIGNLTISAPWSRATPKGAAVAAGFLVIHNSGSSPDRLLGGESDAAKEVQVHEMAMDNQIMKMRQLARGLEIPAGATVELKPGGYHLMLMGLARPLSQDDRYKMTLNFERAGKTDVEFRVGGVGGAAPAASQGHMHDQGDHAVVAVLMTTFDRPEARLKVEPVVMDGDLAIAGWVQDGRGGRALLRRVSGQWKIVLCAGEPLKHRTGMVTAGIEPMQAGRMAALVLAAESKLAPATIALLDSFEGTMMMGADGAHPATHGQGAPAGHGAHGHH